MTCHVFAFLLCGATVALPLAGVAADAQTAATAPAKVSHSRPSKARLRSFAGCLTSDAQHPGTLVLSSPTTGCHAVTGSGLDTYAGHHIHFRGYLTSNTQAIVLSGEPMVGESCSETCKPRPKHFKDREHPGHEGGTPGANKPPPGSPPPTR